MNMKNTKKSSLRSMRIRATQDSEYTQGMNTMSMSMPSPPDYSNKLIRSENFTNIDLKGAKFINTTLVTTSFENLDLTGADFTNSTSYGLSFIGTNIDKVNFTKTILRAPTFKDVKNIETATITNITIDKGPLTINGNDVRGSFQNINLSNRDLNNSKLRNSNFTNVDFTNTNLTGADLSGSTFTNTTFTNTTFSNTICPDGTVTNTGC